MKPVCKNCMFLNKRKKEYKTGNTNKFKFGCHERKERTILHWLEDEGDVEYSTCAYFEEKKPLIQQRLF